MALLLINNGCNGGAISASGTRWRQDCIWIDIDPELDSRQAEFEAAVGELNSLTRGCFELKRWDEVPVGDKFMYFVPSTGCSSWVGQVCNFNQIQIAPGCNKASIQHEIMHALGIHHEHQRSDRGSFIQINLQNVASGMGNQFTILPDALLFGEYDLDSVMHYGGTAFSGNGGFTIQTRNQANQPRIGQRNGLSPEDINTINYILNMGLPVVARPRPELACQAAGNSTIELVID